jgi:hypothetical protein
MRRENRGLTAIISFFEPEEVARSDRCLTGLCRYREVHDNIAKAKTALSRQRYPLFFKKRGPQYYCLSDPYSLNGLNFLFSPTPLSGWIDQYGVCRSLMPPQGYKNRKAHCRSALLGQCSQQQCLSILVS